MRSQRLGLTAQGTPAESDLVGVRKLIDNDVYDSSGNYVGKLEEIVMDFRSGCARHAVVGVGGVFGIGRRRLAVPWGALSAESSKRRCIVDIAQMDLTAVEVSRDDSWLRRPAIKSARGAGAVAAGD